MADIRGIPDAVAFALVQAHNQIMVDNISTHFHLSRFETVQGIDYKNPTILRGGGYVGMADVTVDVDGWALANSIKRVTNVHFADTNAHDTAVSATITIADAVDTASAVTLVNGIKAAVNTHFDAANVHFTNDDTNTITNADSTDDPTMQVLVNELKNKFVVIHTQDAPAGHFINLVLP